MKQVIYIDVLIFLNVIITFLLLLASSKMIKIYPSAGRLTVASVLGGFSSLIILAPEMGLFLSLLTKLLFSLVIVTCAFNPKTLGAIAKETAYFFAANFIFAGTMLFASSLPGISLVNYNNGAVYINFSFFSLIASCVICYGVTCLLNRFSKHRESHCEVFYAEIFMGKKSVKSPAIADSGNALTDPYTGKAVIVSDKATLSEILPYNIKEYFDNGICDGIKLIPCKTVSGSALLPCFKADRIIIKNDKIKIETENSLIAVSSEKLTEIILPVSVISERRVSDVTTG